MSAVGRSVGVGGTVDHGWAGGKGRRDQALTDRDWLLWAIECAEMFGRRWRALPDGQPARIARHVPPPNVTACALPPLPAATKVAREFARRTVDDWGVTALTENVAIVVSELVTNALRHAPLTTSRGGAQWRIQLSLAGSGQHVMCAVTDSSSDSPVRQRPDVIDESGRGLHIVDYFSNGWGWLPRSTGGKVVWALFNVSD